MSLAREVLIEIVTFQSLQSHFEQNVQSKSAVTHSFAPVAPAGANDCISDAVGISTTPATVILA